MKLTPGDDAPFFSRVDHENNTVTLDDYAGHRVLIYFYPKAFTPGCTGESCDFRDRHDLFYRNGYEILGVSPDSPDELAKFRTEYGLAFPLLSDPDHTMAEAYGAWGTKKNYGKEYVGLIRSTFAIDESAVITDAWYNVRAKEHAARVQRELLPAAE